MKKNKGFTLIELLVVIAIIGILASVVLSNLNNAKIHAQDVARISLIRQYEHAIELFNADNDALPNPNGIHQPIPGSNVGWCLGYTDLEACSDETNGRNALNAQLAKYIPGTPAERTSYTNSPIGNNIYRGIMYQCLSNTCESSAGFILEYPISLYSSCPHNELTFDEYKVCIDAYQP